MTHRVSSCPAGKPDRSKAQTAQRWCAHRYVLNVIFWILRAMTPRCVPGQAMSISIHDRQRPIQSSAWPEAPESRRELPGPLILAVLLKQRRWMYLGDHARSLPSMHRALRLSPAESRTPMLMGGIATIHFLRDEFDQAFSWADKGLRLDPTNMQSLRAMAMSAASAGRQRPCCASCITAVATFSEELGAYTKDDETNRACGCNCGSASVCWLQGVRCPTGTAQSHERPRLARPKGRNSAAPIQLRAIGIRFKLSKNALRSGIWRMACHCAPNGRRPSACPDES